MSNLYGGVSGDMSKTSATRRGCNHLDVYAQGWNFGIRVNIHRVTNDKRGGDHKYNVSVRQTSGSNGRESSKLIFEKRFNERGEEVPWEEN